MASIKQSTARNRSFLMIDSTDHISGKTGLTVTVTLSKNGASFASAGGSVTELANGWYYVAFNTTDTGTLGDLAVHCSATGADPTDWQDEVTTQILGDTLTANATQAGGTVWGAGAITAASIAADAITAAKIADGAIDAATFAAGAINAAAIAADAITDAKVASDVTIASVTGAVGSVTGAVGSVTGNVGGNVTGSVGSVVGAVGSVTGNVGGNVVGSVASVTAKTGYSLAATGLDSITATRPSGIATTFPQMLVLLYYRFFGKSTLTSTQLKTLAANGTTVVTTQTVSDDGTTQTQGEAS